MKTGLVVPGVKEMGGRAVRREKEMGVVRTGHSMRDPSGNGNVLYLDCISSVSGL